MKSIGTLRGQFNAIGMMVTSAQHVSFVAGGPFCYVLVHAAAQQFGLSLLVDRVSISSCLHCVVASTATPRHGLACSEWRLRAVDTTIDMGGIGAKIPAA